MENPLLHNLLNKPAVLEEGQVWSFPKEGVEFIITKTFPGSDVVRASILAAEKYLADGKDVSLKNDQISEIFGRERFVLRITDGPVHKKWFKVFLGKVNDNTLAKIKESLGDSSFDHDEAQRALIGQLLESLEVLRQDAIGELDF